MSSHASFPLLWAAIRDSRTFIENLAREFASLSPRRMFSAHIRVDTSSPAAATTPCGKLSRAFVPRATRAKTFQSSFSPSTTPPSLPDRAFSFSFLFYLYARSVETNVADSQPWNCHANRVLSNSRINSLPCARVTIHLLRWTQVCNKVGSRGHPAIGWGRFFRVSEHSWWWVFTRRDWEQFRRSLREFVGICCGR